MDNKLSILVIEDDHELAHNIQRFIDFADVKLIADGLQGMDLAQTSIFDLIILDIMLPTMNGFDVLKSLRLNFVTTPVLILTAKDTLADKIRGFGVGADDYLTKPFHREELILRVQAILKREGRLKTIDELELGNMKLHIHTHEVSVGETNISLNPKEFEILLYLIQNKNTIITKAQLFERIWGLDSTTGLSVVEVYLSNLRKKLKAATGFTIQTLRNVGYVLKSEIKTK